MAGCGDNFAKEKEAIIKEEKEAIIKEEKAAMAMPMFSNMNGDGVSNNPPYIKSLTLKADQDPILVEKISTYHWNNGLGTASPGTISIWENGQMLGKWQATGRSYSGHDNIYWDVYPNFLMKPGHTYEIHDSDQSTWSWNESSGNCGMLELTGTYQPVATNDVISFYGWKLIHTSTRSMEDTRTDQYATDYSYEQSNGLMRHYSTTTHLHNPVQTTSFEATCTPPPSHAKAGQKITMDIRLTMTETTRDQFYFGTTACCQWGGPGKAMDAAAPYFYNIKDEGNPHPDTGFHLSAGTGGGKSNYGDSATVFHVMPANPQPGDVISFYFAANGSQTEWRYEWQQITQ